MILKILNSIFFINKYYFTILILSFLSLIPFTTLIIEIRDLEKLSHITKINDAFIKNVLSRTLMSPYVFWTFLFGLLIWISSAILVVISWKNNKVSKIYGMLTLALGGIGSHFFYLIIVFIKQKINKFNNLNFFKWLSKNTLIFPIICFIFGGFFPFIIFMPSFDDSTKVEKINYSLNKKSPNLIEIFTDGFDQWNKNDYKNEETFKDFNWFNNVQSVGNITHRSLATIYQDFKEWNPFALRKKYNFSAKELTNYLYGNGWLVSGVKHLREHESNFNQLNIVNTIAFSNKNSYGASISGTPKAIKKIYSKINAVNWSSARDEVVGKFGISHKSPDAISYDFLSSKYTISKTAKGARIFISDLITHRPFLNSENLTFNPFIVDKNSSKNALKNILVKTFKKLGFGQKNSIFDNSMIIIYGDHSSHDNIIRKQDKTINFLRKAETALMIKYPHHSNHHSKQMNIINDKYIYAASINRIINDYFENKRSNPLDLFNEKYFTNTPKPIFTKNNVYTMAKWDNNKLISIGDEKTYNNTQAQIDDLNRVVY